MLKRESFVGATAGKRLLEGFTYLAWGSSAGPTGERLCQSNRQEGPDEAENIPGPERVKPQRSGKRAACRLAVTLLQRFQSGVAQDTARGAEARGDQS